MRQCPPLRVNVAIPLKYCQDSSLQTGNMPLVLDSFSVQHYLSTALSQCSTISVQHSLSTALSVQYSLSTALSQ